jgi:hypothetical protein
LPDSYPGITFDELGICSQCNTSTVLRYEGGEALRDRILSFLESYASRNSDYDCVLALSGGRDSAYLLYYLAQVLSLRVVAYTVDNGFMPDQTRANLHSMADILNVDLVFRESPYLQRCIAHHIRSWMHRPSPAMIGLICTGCRLALDTCIPQFAQNQRIPVIISGSTPFEGYSYKERLMSLDPNNESKYAFVLGYLARVIRNPRWIMNRACLATQAQEGYSHFLQRGSRGRRLLRISPFYRYIRWEEQEIISTIEDKLQWRVNPDIESSWRGDCEIALLKLYLYKRTLGYNDKDEGLSHLIRDDQISREEGLRRLAVEGEVPEEVIRGLFARLGLDFADLEEALR